MLELFAILPVFFLMRCATDADWDVELGEDFGFDLRGNFAVLVGLLKSKLVLFAFDLVGLPFGIVRECSLPI